MELCDKTIHELNGMLSKKEILPSEIMNSVLSRMEKTGGFRSFIKVFPEQALELAVRQDSAPVKGALAGIPVAVKDNMCIENKETTCASHVLKSFIAPYTATAVLKLLGAGAIVIGKTNMDEFAMGSSTETSFFGKTLNPWNKDMVPGGSSGGSATSVALGEAIGSLGSDTGGSIRQPASLCGLVGLKPTYGRVSRYGLVAFASSLDQIGPFAKDVEDAAILLKAISGYDVKDSTSVNREAPDYVTEMKKEIKGLKIGVPEEYFSDGIDEEVGSCVKKAVKDLERCGAEVKNISLPHTEYAVATYYIIATAEASSNLARYDGVHYGLRENAGNIIDLYKKTRSVGFGDEVKRRIILGTYVLSSGYYDAYYLKAQKARTLIKEDFSKAFDDVDVIITPTSPTTAWRIGEKTSDPLKMYLSDIYTISANLAGIPSVSVNCGFSGGLPVGLQLQAAHFNETVLLRAAYSFEQMNDYHKKRAFSGK
ncbi:MAG: Asp-tRNA(Asn)/Glu-tRNA(Gln) amidotransferase subunit GatA [bacterium]|nr:Asp-tRNA(Asn)/Glu-tRNA(Gln) amidotransferase subunit GatA [bacterium]